jgi:hypothetical protein
LSSTDAAYADYGQRSEVNAVALVPICATVIIRNTIALQDGHEGKLRCQFAEAEEVGHCPPLVLVDC